MSQGPLFEKYFYDDLIDLLCLMPLSAIFQLYHGDQFESPSALFFVIYKAGRKPTQYL
jgi:hypothetical protein